MNRKQLEKLYENETGLSAAQGQERIDKLERFVANNNISDVNQMEIVDDKNKMRRDYRNGIRWQPGKQIDDTILLGYTNGGGGYCKSAIFVSLV